MGKLIIIEGMDGSGTTTQTKMLANYLMGLGYKVLSTAEPTNSSIGQEIRKWLKEPLEKEPHLLTMLALCFAADRMHHINFVIAPALKTHDFILVDRYVMSSMVYQGLHLPANFVSEINKFALKPDLTLLLDTPAHIAYERIASRQGPKDFYETVPMLNRLRERYVHFVQLEAKNTALIDGSASPNEVHNHVVSVISNKLERAL
jgi:dTMP kinase